MELKDVILSTLAEMEEPIVEKIVKTPKVKVEKVEIQKEIESPNVILKEENLIDDNFKIDSELIYLKSIRERLLVLFEGFQAPNNTNIEVKIDMTLNYLEYVLATTESRIQLLKGNKK